MDDAVNKHLLVPPQPNCDCLHAPVGDSVPVFFEHRVTLDWYDMPVLYEAADIQGNRYFIVMIGKRTAHDGYLVRATQHDELQAFYNNEMDWSAFVASGTCWYMEDTGDTELMWRVDGAEWSTLWDKGELWKRTTRLPLLRSLLRSLLRLPRLPC